MNEENDSGTRNFEPVQPEAPKPKREIPDRKKIITIAIFAVATVLLLLFCAVIIAEIVYKVNGDTPADKTDTAKNDITFTTVSLASADVHHGDLQIINKTYAINAATAAEVAEAKVNVYAYNSKYTVHYRYLETDKLSLLPSTIEKFNAMTNGLYNDMASGILIAYGYLVPNAKTLEIDYAHQLGTVVDIKLDSSSTLASNATVQSWFDSNAAKYGFINSDPGNTVHGTDETIASTQFRYVGIAHATYIKNNSLTLDAYIESLHTKTSDSPLIIGAADGNTYAVYYVASTGDATTVKVPQNHTYTVSGDNIAGFIVTVNLSD